MNGNVRYHYRTPDGGPPSDGKPPSSGGPPPPYSPFPFGAPPSAPPGPFAFCGPPPAAPNPATVFCTATPPAAPGGPPGMVCWSSQPPDSSKSMCWLMQPPDPPKPVVWANGCPPTAPHRNMAAAGSSHAPHPPDPGNRVNNRVVKADDGTGVLCSEDMTAFHVLQPGRWFYDGLTKSCLERPKDFTVQYADSDWSVQKFIQRLGGLTDRLSSGQKGTCQSDISVEEWHETGNGKFERGSCIFYNNPRARMSLREMGWGPEHGKAGQKPPIWVMLYP